MPTFLQQVKSSLSSTLLPAGSLSADDDQCVEVSVYYFVLTLPKQSVSDSGEQNNVFVVPLVLNPQMMALSEPFSMVATQTQGAGLYIERNGIVQRSLRIRGTTGFVLQPWQGNASQLATKLPPRVGQDWNRTLNKYVPTGTPLSGQKHFQYLQDAVFRIYGQFSKDPTTTADTSLVFQNPRDGESWRVEPRSFTMERSAKNPLCYDYDIDLLIVEAGDGVGVASAPDKGILEQLRDKIALVQKYTDASQAYVNQLTAAAADLRTIVTGIDAIIFSAGAIITAVGNFIAGVTTLIESPYSVLVALSFAIDDVAKLIETAIRSGKSFPEVHRQAVLRLQNSINNIGLHPDLFQDPTALVNKIKQSLQTYEDQAAQAAVLAAQQTANPTSNRAASNLGTSLLPGDVIYAQAQKGFYSDLVNYTGAHPYQVKVGDTLANLAARFLGDANRWVYIAAANDLRPPYLQAQAATPLVPNQSAGSLAGLGLGSTVYIPDFSTPVTQQENAAVLGAKPTDPVASQLFGTDLAIGSSASDMGLVRTQKAGDLLDLLIDHERGGTDFLLATGATNLAQAVVNRLGTEIGTDTLYPSTGVAPLVATNVQAVDNQTALLVVRTALTQDPRVASVNSLTLSPGKSLDSIVVEGVLQASSSSAPLPISLTLT